MQTKYVYNQTHDILTPPWVLFRYEPSELPCSQSQMAPPSTRYANQRTRSHSIYLIHLLYSHVLFFCFAFSKMRISTSHPLYKTLQCISPTRIKTKTLNMTNKVLHGLASAYLSSLSIALPRTLWHLITLALLFISLCPMLPTAVKLFMDTISLHRMAFQLTLYPL